MERAVAAGFTLFTYSEVAGLLMPLNQGPVAEFKRFMEVLQKDVLSDSAYAARPVVILAHSRGGLISRAHLSDPEVKGASASRFPAVRGPITLSTPHSNRKLIEVAALEALVHAAQGNEEATLAALRQAVELAAPGGALRLLVDCGPGLIGPLQKLQGEGVVVKESVERPSRNRLADPDR